MFCASTIGTEGWVGVALGGCSNAVAAIASTVGAAGGAGVGIGAGKVGAADGSGVGDEVGKTEGEVEVEMITGFCNATDEIGVEVDGKGVEDRALVDITVGLIVGETSGVERSVFDALNPYPTSSACPLVERAVVVASVEERAAGLEAIKTVRVKSGSG